MHFLSWNLSPTTLYPLTPYSYKLKMVEEQLADESHLRTELARRVAEKRMELLRRMEQESGRAIPAR